MEYKNQIILDGKIQKDVKYFSDIINFNISSVTGVYQIPEGGKRNRYTFIRSIYEGPIDNKIRTIICQGNYVRVYGSIDSEQYKSQTGKIVYNKILRINKIKLLKYNEYLDEFEEI